MHERAYLDHLASLQAEAWPANAPREAHYPHGQKPLSEYLRAWASTQPDRPALAFYGHSITWA